MTKTKTEVATKPVDETMLPAYLRGLKIENDDNFDSSDIVLPRIKLLQGLSPEIEQFDEAKSGMFWHTGLDISLGTSIKFAIGDRRKKYLLQAPIADGQGILSRSDDAITWSNLGSWSVKIKGQKNPVTWKIESLDVAESGLTEWGTSVVDDENSPPAATLFYDYLVLLPDFPDLGPSIMSLARSGIKKAKKGLNDKIAMHKNNGRPMQALLFTADSVEETSDDGPFKNWMFKSAGFVQDEVLFGQLTELRGALANVRIQDEGDTGENDVVSNSDTGDGSF